MTGSNDDHEEATVWSDRRGSIPLRVAPMIILGLSILVLVILYSTTT